MSDDFDHIEEIRGICESMVRNRFNLKTKRIEDEMWYLMNKLDDVENKQERELKKAREGGMINCLESQIRNLDRLKTELKRVGDPGRVTDILTGIQHQWRTDIEKIKSGQWE